MPKLVINDKSGKKNTSMNFFLDDKVIKFKENKHLPPSLRTRRIRISTARMRGRRGREDAAYDGV